MLVNAEAVRSCFPSKTEFILKIITTVSRHNSGFCLSGGALEQVSRENHLSTQVESHSQCHRADKTMAESKMEDIAR